MKHTAIILFYLLFCASAANAFNSEKVVTELGIKDKDLNALLSKQYAHESLELDKMKEIPGHIPNVILPQVKSDLINGINQIVEYQESVLMGAPANKRCQSAIDKYRLNGLNLLKSGLADYIANESTLMSGAQLLDMHYRRAHGDFLTGPVVECGTSD